MDTTSRAVAPAVTGPRPDAVPQEPEAAVVSRFLTDAATRPVGLVIMGEAGIGKTTLWLTARQHATDRGFRVLSAGGDPGEVRLTFAALADLLADVDQDVIDRLPPVQRGALNRILLRGNDGPAMDERAAASAFQAVVHHLAADTPVLIAIDDVQWLDVSSTAVVRFAVRRLSGAVGLLVTARTDEAITLDVLERLQLPRPDALTRLQMSPLTLGGLHALLSERMGRVFPRPTMTRIHEISGGNRLYALELARTAASGHRIDQQLPDRLAEVVRARVEHLDAETEQLLLTAAATPAPTVELVAKATATPVQRAAELLERAATAGIVAISGNRVRFAHPLLATGVYTRAAPGRRRETHRRLADCVELQELKARHLASASVIADNATLDALDAAADTTRARGAPAAAAELADLAITLGGDSPQRRIRAAEHHFRAGSPGVAQRMLQSTIDGLPPSPTRCLALMLLAAVLGYGDDTAGAVRALTQAAHEAEDDTAVRLHCLLHLVAATVMIGRVDHAVDHAKSAVALADRLGVPELRSQALSIWVTVSFVYGMGVDHPALQTALQCEDPHSDATTWYTASAVQAMICAWTGDLHEARRQMCAVRARMLDNGTEVDIIWACNHLATIDVWLGRYTDAAQASREAVERAEQMGGRHLLITAWGWLAAVAAYTGDDADARAAANAAISAAHEIGAPYLVDAPSATLAFLEVSLGNYGAAMTSLEPLLERFDPSHQTELVSGGWLPDAVEALTGLGRLDEARILVKVLHDNGIRTNRAWMLAMAGRGEALCRAARGDLAGAEEAAAAAMVHHDRLPMPFERARTQLLLGQLQRRSRRRRQAAATLEQALRAFEGLGTPLWAERTRVELARLNTTGRPRLGLTPAEWRIAQRAAAGLSNKEIAAEQFLAIKTVEMTLSSVYRKLGIRSRAQLHPRLGGEDLEDSPVSPSA